MKTRFLVISAIILACAGWRLLPHGWNFAPVGALALFTGAYLSPRWTAFAVPFLAMILSDLVLYQTHRQEFDLGYYLTDRVVVYSCFAVMVGIGFWLRQRRTALAIVGSAVVGSLFFFLATNFAVWLTGGGLGYPMTLEGLYHCYVAAIPFYRNTAVSDAIFTLVFFGGFALAERWIPGLRESARTPAGVSAESPMTLEQAEPAIASR
jgi:hypothetical protein